MRREYEFHTLHDAAVSHDCSSFTAKHGVKQGHVVDIASCADLDKARFS